MCDTDIDILRRFQKLIDLMPSVLKSKLLICSPLKTWTNETGEITLLGDACHPMLVSAR